MSFCDTQEESALEDIIIRGQTIDREGQAKRHCPLPLYVWQSKKNFISFQLFAFFNVLYLYRFLFLWRDFFSPRFLGRSNMSESPKDYRGTQVSERGTSSSPKKRKKGERKVIMRGDQMQEKKKQTDHTTQTKNVLTTYGSLRGGYQENKCIRRQREKGYQLEILVFEYTWHKSSSDTKNRPRATFCLFFFVWWSAFSSLFFRFDLSDQRQSIYWNSKRGNNRHPF